MTVYIEYVFLDNLIIDCMLLYFSLVCVRVRTRWFRLLLSAAFGAVFACFTPLIPLNGAVLFVVKFFVGQAMVVLSAKFKSIYEYIKAFVCFIVFTFVCGGGIIAVFSMAGVDLSLVEGSASLYKISELPMGVILLGVLLICVMTKKLLVYVRKRWDIKNFERQVGIFDGEDNTFLQGFIDTGNRLYDERTGKPVCVVNKSVAERLVLSGAFKMRGAHYTPLATASGRGKILVFEIDRLMIYCGEERNIIDNAMIGISPVDTPGADVIINAALI